MRGAAGSQESSSNCSSAHPSATGANQSLSQTRPLGLAPRTRRRHEGRARNVLTASSQRLPFQSIPTQHGDDPDARCLALGLPLVPCLPPAPQGFRFWLDEVLWSQGRVAVEVIDEVLQDSGGIRTGGPPRSAVQGPMDRVLGSEHADRWELLWSKSTYALKAARSLRPGQQISAIVGLNTLTMKKRMLQALKAAYGNEGAWQLTPVSFALPEEMEQWREWVVAAHSASRSCAFGCGDSGKGSGHKERSSSLSRGLGVEADTDAPTQGASQDRGGMGVRASASASSRGSEGGCPCSAFDSELWILKTGQDAGKGLQLLTLRNALQTAEQRWEQSTSKRKHQLQVAQLYLTRPLLLEGRKSHLRLWVVVTHHSPLEAFLHRKGLVLFSSELYDSGHPFAHHQSEDTPPPPQGLPHHGSMSAGLGHDLSSVQSRAAGKISASHLTNLARNSSGLVWGLDGLERALGGPAYASLWTQLLQCTAATLRATKGALKEAHAWLRPSIPEYGFQLLGFDYMLDQDLKPWLIEVNSAPSIMAEHDDPATAAAIRVLKQAMLRDMMALVGHRIWRQEPDNENMRQGGHRASGPKSGNEQHGKGPSPTDFVWLDTR